MRTWVSLFILLFLTFACSSQQLYIIPRPVTVQIKPGKFIISKKTVITARDEGDKKTAQLLNEYLQQIYGFKLDIDDQEGKDYIRFSTKKFIQAPDKDAYTLNVTGDGVTIEGDTYAGTFYGMQTLIQLLPVGNNIIQTADHKLEVPFASIQDYPRFAYRGMHLDVGRHFFPASFIKKYIDNIALHKMNYFHWHLTEDQGWRIEIKKYPNLTQVGAYRNGTIIGRNPGTGNDNTRYGGFYTQAEVKEIVSYAADRHITVMPEIELPGHSSAAIASYPWLSCFASEPTRLSANASLVSKQTGGKLVQESWGVFEDVYCAGNDSTFMFLQDVMDEVLQLFPSKFIHVGGDECPKSNWKKCPKCQKRMKDFGLKDEHELQSYFIQRMEKYLNSKNRTLIGWDEILEGGLAPNAVVMSWRGEKGGVEAAKQNHNVVMTPDKPVYFDHAQTRNEDSLVFGGFNPIEAVYAYEPVPKELDNAKTKFVLGSQANVWTEYMKYPNKVEYMILPRMSALSEVLWSPKGKRNWTDFEKRLQMQIKRYDLWKVNYSKAYYALKATILPAKDYNGLLLKLESKNPKGKIKYSYGATSKHMDYKVPVLIRSSNSYLGQLYTDNKISSSVSHNFSFNKATGKKIIIITPPNERYPGQGGAFGLVNGIYSSQGLSNPDWLGWIGEDPVASIDLGKKDNFSSIKIHTIVQNSSWIYLPDYVEILTSNDGKKFISAGKSSEFVNDTLNLGWITVNFPKQTSRYIKLIVKNYGMIPEGKPGAGNKAWLIVDEIQVY